MTLIKPLPLANLPTPLHRLDRLSARWKGDIWIKRDDLTGSGLTGNKVRKLEYLLSEAREKKADTIITCGGVQSNHCRATALACAKYGFRCLLLLRGERPSGLDSNLMLDILAGAEPRFIPDDRYHADLPGELSHLAAEVKSGGGSPYIIPEGGSNPVGAWSYVEALREVHGQCAKLGCCPERILCANGSGGTHAGLLLGALIEGWNVKIISATVCYSTAETVARVAEIIDGMIDRYNLDCRYKMSDIRVIDDYLGEGYAKPDRDVFDVIAEVARCEGIILDPVYTGKAARAVKCELAKGSFKDTTLFWHTGGVFGLFPFRDGFDYPAI